MRMELKEGDSLKGSAHTPMYNPNILPLSRNFQKYPENVIVEVILIAKVIY